MAIERSTSGNDLLHVTNGINAGGLGNDTYVLSPTNIAPNAKIKIIDAGVNTIRLDGGLTITNSAVASNTTKLTLSNGAEVTILGSSAFTYVTADANGNPIGSSSQSYSGFVANVLNTTVPAAPVTGAAPVINTGTGGAAISSTGAVTLIPSVKLTASVASINETTGGNTVTYTATLSSAAASNLSIPYTLSGTGITTSDFTGLTALTGNISILAGASSGILVLNAAADATTESAETLSVALGAVASLAVNTAPVSTTIVDTSSTPAGTPTVTLTASATNITETAGGNTVTYTATLTGGTSTTALSIPYTLSGTGITTGDFIPTLPALTGTINIPANATTGSVTLTVANDTTTEGNETLSVALLNTVTGVTVNTAAVSTTIADTSLTPLPVGTNIATTIATDNIVNAAEKATGVVLSGAKAAGASVAVTWGSTTQNVAADALTTWSSTFASAAVPADAASTTISVVASNAGGSAAAVTKTVAVDTIAPTQTITGTAISADTGVSATDGITKTALQTVTATLSAPLATGDVLWGSVDNGANWGDWTSAVTGTAISKTGVTLSGSNSILISVEDTAGNYVQANWGVKTYVLDTTAPTNASTVLATSATQAPGAAVTITSAAETGGAVWLAPTGTTTFTAGATMTTAAGTATSILAPATTGNYTLFVIDAAGNVSSPSTAAITVSGFINSSLDGLGSSSAAVVPLVLANTGAINYTDSVATANNVTIANFGADDKITITGATSAVYDSAISVDGSSNVVISYNSAGQLNTITLTGLTPGFVNDVTSFNAMPVGNLFFA